MKRFVLVFVMLGTATALAQFEHPDLKTGRKAVRSIMVLPVHAEMTKVGVKGGEPLMEESREVEKSLAPIIGDVLRKLGCTVDDQSLTPEVLAKNPEVGYAVDDLQKQFDAELKQMARKSKDVRKGRFTLGDSVAKLTAGEKVDALLFVRASGQVLTGGKKAFGVIFGGPVYDMLQMHLGVVDANSGDVLYFARPFMLKNPAKDPGSTRVGVEKSFKNFVKANTAVAKGGTPEARTDTAAAKSETAPPAATGASTESTVATAPSASTVPPAAGIPAQVVATSAEAAPPPVPAEVKTGAADEAGATAVRPVSAPTPGALPTAPIAAPVVAPALARPAGTSGVYYFAVRTPAHSKRSSSDVFEGIVDEIGDFLAENNVMLRDDPIRKRHSSEIDIPATTLLKDLADTRATYLLYIAVDRPASQWVKLTLQCYDESGKMLWQEEAGSGMGGVSGAGGVKHALEKAREKLRPHFDSGCLPLKPTASQSAK